LANFSTRFASVVDTGGKFATGVNDTGGKLPPVSTTPSANCHRYQRHSRQIATGINDTGGKFATGVNDTGGKQCEQFIYMLTLLPKMSKISNENFSY
jgi:hypothetical protein